MGLQTRITGNVGSFDAERHFLGLSPGATEVDLEEDLVASARITRHLQASMLLPVDQTFRKVPGISEWGGGFGDISWSARYDFIEAGFSRSLPGIALIAALTVPTGKPTEETSTPLATGGTGTGAAQAAFGASLEKDIGHVLLDLTGSATWRARRAVGAIHEQDGALFVVSASGAYSFDSGLVLALSLAYSAELSGTVEGETVEDGGKAFTRAGASAGYAFSDHWRGQAVFFTDLPIRYLGQSEPAGVGASCILLRTWP